VVVRETVLSSFLFLANMKQSPPAYFKDHSKEANDLLFKGFPSNDKTWFAIEVSIPEKANRLAFNKSIKSALDTGAITHSLDTKYRYSDLATFGVNITGNELKISHTFTTPKVPGLTNLTEFSLSNFESCSLQKINFKDDVKFSNPYLASFFSFSSPLKDGSGTLNASIVLGNSQFLSGGAEIDTNLKALSSVNLLTTVKHDFGKTTAFFNNNFDKREKLLGITHHQNFLNNNLKPQLAVKATYNLDSAASTVTLGTGFNFQHPVVTFVKAKVDSNLAFGLAFTLFKAPFTVQPSFEFKVVEKSYKYGVKVSLTD